MADITDEQLDSLLPKEGPLAEFNELVEAARAYGKTQEEAGKLINGASASLGGRIDIMAGLEEMAPRTKEALNRLKTAASNLVKAETKSSGG